MKRSNPDDELRAQRRLWGVLCFVALAGLTTFVLLWRSSRPEPRENQVSSSEPVVPHSCDADAIARAILTIEQRLDALEAVAGRKATPPPEPTEPPAATRPATADAARINTPLRTMIADVAREMEIERRHDATKLALRMYMQPGQSEVAARRVERIEPILVDFVDTLLEIQTRELASPASAVVEFGSEYRSAFESTRERLMLEGELNRDSADTAMGVVCPESLRGRR